MTTLSKLCLSTALFAFFLCSTDADTFSHQYEQHRTTEPKPDAAATEKFLLDGEKEHAEDPAYWVARGNFYFNQSSVVTINQKKPEKGDFAIRDSETGKTVGSLSGGRDPEKIKKAIAALEEGVKRFPQRLDIRFGICYIQQETGAFDQQLAGMKAAVAYAKKNPKKLEWLGGKAYSLEGVRDTIHTYFANQYKLETEVGDKRMLAIAKLYAEEFPNDSRAHNNLAACASINKDYKAVVTHLKNAHEANSQDGVVLMNLADALAEKLDKPEEAKIYYKKVIALKDADELKAKAEEALAKLEEK